MSDVQQFDLPGQPRTPEGEAGRLRRILVLLTVALLLVPAGPAFAQQGAEDPPASQGPSGTGGNTPNAGRTGGGTESPSRSTDSGASGKILAVIGAGFLIVVLAAAASAWGRQKAAEDSLANR